MQRLFLATALLCAALLAVSGCGRGRESMGQVSGTVRYQGEPIRDGRIVFEVSGNRPASGMIVDGQITQVTTFETNDGVPVGSAKIAVRAFADGNTASAVMDHPGDIQRQETKGYMDVPESLLPDRYADPETSGLTFQIERGENVLDLDLTP